MFDMSFGSEVFTCHAYEGEGGNFYALGSENVRRRLAVDPCKVNAGQLPPVRTLPSQLEALATLRHLRRYTRGWNGPGSSEASSASFDLSEKFLGLLSSVGVTFHIDAMIHSCGTAVIAISSPTVSGRFEFMPDGDIAANIDDDDGEHDIDVVGFDGSHIPGELAGYLYPARATVQCRAA